MALCSLVRKLPQETMEDLYKDQFPIDIRFCLAEWIEHQPWEFINPMDPSNVAMASSLVSKLVAQILSLSSRCPDKNVARLLCQHARNIELQYQAEPLKLVEVMTSIIQKEKKSVLEQFGQLPPSIQEKQKQLDFLTNLSDLLKNVSSVQAMRGELKQICEELRMTRRDCTALQSGHSGESLLKLQNKLENVSIAGKNLQEKLGGLIQKVVQDLEVLLGFVVKKIHRWKRQQQLSGNGAPFDDNLSSIQEWSETLVDVLFQMSQELLHVRNEVEMDSLPELTEKLNSALNTLITSTFLVHKQPPQVLKTQARFDAGVRFLLGVKLLNMCQKLPTVKAMVITELQARNLGVPGQMFNESTGEILNNIATLENNIALKTCCATFKNPKLQKIKRSDRKGSESVTEEKFAILFSTEITLSINNTKYNLQVLSLPIVVIVHGSQDNNAAATILWDNAFSEIDRVPFVVPDRVPWPQMCETLNMKFMAEVQTSRGLIKEHFFFLAQKIFGDNSTNMEDFQNRYVSWAQFNKEVLPGRGFTFWQWFDGVLDLTKEFLKSYWSEGLIIGFISKTYVHNLLSTKNEGTFLLRFSDSEIGGITIAYISKQTDNGQPQILNIQPFTTKDLKIRALGDRIRDIKLLQYLYPNQPKDVVFQKYYTKEQNRKDGYINSKIVTTVEGAPVQSPQGIGPPDPQDSVMELTPSHPRSHFQPPNFVGGLPSPAVSPVIPQHIQDVPMDHSPCPPYPSDMVVYPPGIHPMGQPPIQIMLPQPDQVIRQDLNMFQPDTPPHGPLMYPPQMYPVQQQQHQLQHQGLFLQMGHTNQPLDPGMPTEQEIFQLIEQEDLTSQQHTDIINEFLAMQDNLQKLPAT